MLRQLFRFQDKKRRMHSPDTAKKTMITRYPPQRQPPRPRQLALKHAILDGLSQRGLLVGAKQVPPYRADLADGRRGQSARRK